MLLSMGMTILWCIENVVEYSWVLLMRRTMMLLCKIKFEFVFGILEHQDGAVLEDDNYVVMFYFCWEPKRCHWWELWWWWCSPGWIWGSGGWLILSYNDDRYVIIIMIMMCSRMKMRVWRRMEMEPVFAHRGEMTLGWILVVTTIIRTTKDKETTSMISN